MYYSETKVIMGGLAHVPILIFIVNLIKGKFEAIAQKVKEVEVKEKEPKVKIVEITEEVKAEEVKESEVKEEIKEETEGVYFTNYSEEKDNIIIVGPLPGDTNKEIVFPVLSPDPSTNKEYHYGKYSLHIGGNRGRGQVYPTGDKSNNVVFTSSTSGTINSIDTIEAGSYKVNIENENGEITTEAVPVGPQLIVKAQDKINAGDPLTNDPNVGGFGQLDAEVVLQSPYRVIGLIAFFIGVGLTQILLVLKKKQVEKVQAAEGI